MGKTLKAIHSEVQNIWNSIFQELSEEEKCLPKSAKKELRHYLASMSSNKIHSFSHIFIRRKIHELQHEHGISEHKIEKDLNDWHDINDYQI